MSVGLSVETIEFAEAELGGGLHDINIVVASADRNAVYATMQTLEGKLIKASGQPVRLGFYDAASGYSDVPVGKAMLQVDCVFLAPQPAV